MSLYFAADSNLEFFVVESILLTATNFYSRFPVVAHVRIHDGPPVQCRRPRMKPANAKRQVAERSGPDSLHFSPPNGRKFNEFSDVKIKDVTAASGGPDVERAALLHSSSDDDGGRIDDHDGSSNQNGLDAHRAAVIAAKRKFPGHAARTALGLDGHGGDTQRRTTVQSSPTVGHGPAAGLQRSTGPAHGAGGSDRDRDAGGAGQLQAEQRLEIAAQDELLDQMSVSLERLGEMGGRIQNEIAQQEVILSDTATIVNDTDAAIKEATKKVKEIIKKNGGQRWCCVIMGLSLLLAILTYFALF